MRVHKNRITVGMRIQSYDYVVNLARVEHVSMSKMIEHIVLEAPMRKLDPISYVPDTGIAHRVTVNFSKEAYAIVYERAVHDDISLSRAVEHFVLESEAAEDDYR